MALEGPVKAGPEIEPEFRPYQFGDVVPYLPR